MRYRTPGAVVGFKAEAKILRHWPGPVVCSGAQVTQAMIDQLLYRLNVDDDREMWSRIRANPQWQRFVDTIFIRILFRFENFANGKKTFMNILNITMSEKSRFVFTEEHFHIVFEALFSELWEQSEIEEQRIRWDFLFGDGTAKRIQTILSSGLERWMKKRKTVILGSGRVASSMQMARKQ